MNKHLMIVLPLLCTTPAVAEGTAQFGVNGRVQTSTALRLDIIDAAVERVSWRGQGTLSVTAADGTVVAAALASGATTGSLAAFGPGAYTLRFSTNQTTANWDIGVVDATGVVVGGGRLYSIQWNLFLNGRGENNALSNSLFALIPGGQAGTDALIEVDFEGLNGNSHQLGMNTSGVEGRSDGRSGPSGSTFVSTVPLFLSPPDRRLGGVLTPTVTLLDYSSEVDGGSCDVVAAGVGGVFSFTTDVIGRYRLVCDLDGDGVASVVDPDDLSIGGDTVLGDNTISWDGTDNDGTAVSLGELQCDVFVSTGELHFLSLDIETAFPGIRMYDVADDGVGRTALPMFWDDSLLPNADVNMPAPSNVPGLVTSGSNGVTGNARDQVPVPNTSARSWGNFRDDGKRGGDEVTDTWTFARASARATLHLTVVGAAVDTDGDGLSDVDEACLTGTDPNDRDSDDDGVIDGDEQDPAGDADGDGINNANDPDSDNDGLLDGTELGITIPDVDTDPAVFVPDADPTTTTDPFKADTDGGGVNDGDEDSNHNGRVDANERDPLDGSDDVRTDTDGDGIADAVEEATGTDPDNADSDGDGIADGVEDANGNGIVDDGESDPREVDSDGDGINDGDEDANGNGVVDPGETSPVDPDTDDDGVCDGPIVVQGVCSPGIDDEDGDGIADEDDNCPTVANANQADGDNDGVGDACDVDRDNDGYADDIEVVGGGVTSCTQAGGSVPTAIAVLALLRRRRRR